MDGGAVARLLSLVSEDPAALVDAFFERREELELMPAGESCGIRTRREEGFAIRLVSGDQTWMVSRDAIDGDLVLEAVRRTARRMAQGLALAPRLRSLPWEDSGDRAEMMAFPAQVETRLRKRRLAFPCRLLLRRHRRWIKVIGREFVGDTEVEEFWSLRADLPGGPWGTLVPALTSDAAEKVASSLSGLFRSRHAVPPSRGRVDLLLGPSAAAVFLHEAVAHALEIDTLAASGDPESAIGYRLGSRVLDLLDDPASGPPGLRRVTDDEGAPVLRRWLLRRGEVAQPLADRRWARLSATLSPGAGRRQSRHSLPGPRSIHLELLPGRKPVAKLAEEVDHGIFVPEASRGLLDPLSGEFEIHFSHGRELRRGKLEKRVGAFSVRGRLGDLLSRVSAIGSDSSLAGAGWCAKGGQRLPVWSTTPSLLIAGVEVEG